MRSLSILFTNNTLSDRAGSELWVRDVCRSLVGRGHRPLAFSLVTGPVADELRAATVPVVTDLDDVGFAPDLIHGHHHIETLIAALHFPGVPIVHFCHGWLPWEEMPLRHPSIARYVAVDETCLDRLTAESGIGRDQVDVLLNFVDLKRFVARDPLPPRPRRALVLSNNAVGDGYAAIIREACQEVGMELEVAGVRAGRVVERPQELFPGFDLVFAKARTALEALAVGCSVILADEVGSGPRVTEQGFERMRACNFGVRLLQNAHSVGWYREQIAGYDSAEVARISARVREEAGLEDAVDRLLEIYDRAMTGRHRDASSDGLTVAWCADAQRAAGRHLGSVAERFKAMYELERTVHRLSVDVEATHGRLEHMADECGTLRRERESLLGERETLRRERGSLLGERDTLLHEREPLLHQRQALLDEVAAARVDNQQLTSERDGLQQLIAAYRALPSLRLRDRLISVPIVGGPARRAARWLSRSAFVRKAR